ncbi:hypothetical protein HH308_14080 [Gordonia sp. TBRC 11910]|uniref:Alpha/beta hydrolase family protein n=1 Tax=Gordonia asplenii TaxID=2725283 RepID=A0A848L143_9ACTN|nr:hypothetical protein [Gordonia asplenii]NMO02343.1 hypothetical protein [Gordonia asplenii]
MGATVVFLHGVGDGNVGKDWLRGLNRSLTDLNHPPIAEREVCAPVYASLLKTTGEFAARDDAPTKTYSPRDERESRRKFQIRQARAAKLIAELADPRVTVDTRLIASATNYAKAVGVATDVIAAVSNYLKNPKLQNAVLGHIINQLPTSGDIILIGHSLGSVIAIDLIDQLPLSLHVKRFITIGSPAGAPALSKHKTRILPDIPYTRVDDWTNLMYHYDIVSMGRGLGATFPGAQDFWVSWPFEPSIEKMHGAETYLAHPAAGKLVADILYPTTDLVPSSSDLAARLDDEEAAVLLTMAYGARVAEYLRQHDGNADEGDSRAARYADALRQLEVSFTDQMKEREAAGRPIPAEFHTLISGVRPAPPRRWNLSEAITQATLLAFTNVVAPYEINVHDARYKVLADLFVDLGFTGKQGQLVGKAVKDVSELVDGGGWSLSPTAKIAAGAAGIALLAAGPIGLAMAGAAGVAGAAAITSSLAAFGPGGMVGGLAMLGGLATTGSMLTTAAATVRDAPQSTLDPTSVAVLIAIAYAHKLIGEPYDSDVWYDLANAETKTAATLNMVEAYSDSKSAAVKRQKEIQALIAKLIAFMEDQKLEPQGVAEILSADETRIVDRKSGVFGWFTGES